MTYLERFTVKPRPVLGYTTRRHLLLDLDDTTYIKASNLVNKIFREWPEVGDCLLVYSSKGKNLTYLRYDNFQRPYHRRDRLNLHLIFDNLIGYNKASKICETLAGLFIINKGYNDIRKFRGDLTLRVSERVERKGVKPIPLILSLKINPYTDKKDGYIKKYLDLLRIAHNLRFFNLETIRETYYRTKGRDYGTQCDPINFIYDGHVLQESNT